MSEAGGCKQRAKYGALASVGMKCFLFDVFYISFFYIHFIIFSRDSFLLSVFTASFTSTTLSAATHQTACESISVQLRSFFKCPRLRLSQQTQNAPFEGAHTYTRTAPSLARPHPKVTSLTALFYVPCWRRGISSAAETLPVPTLSSPHAFPTADSIRHCEPFHRQ